MIGGFDMIVVVLVVLALVFAGVHIAVALGITAAFGIYMMLGDITVVRNFVANTAYEALRDYVKGYAHMANNSKNTFKRVWLDK